MAVDPENVTGVWHQMHNCMGTTSGLSASGLHHLQQHPPSSHAPPPAAQPFLSTLYELFSILYTRAVLKFGITRAILRERLLNLLY